MGPFRSRRMLLLALFSSLSGIAVAQQRAERLLLQAPETLLREVAEVNPDVAAHLQLLSRFSALGSPPLPMAGDGRFSKLQTRASVLALLQAKDAQADIEPLMAALPARDEASITRYSVTRAGDGRASLLGSQRVIAKDGTELAQPHPDIRLELRWVTSGHAGYWQAVSWRAVGHEAALARLLQERQLFVQASSAGDVARIQEMAWTFQYRDEEAARIVQQFNDGLAADGTAGFRLRDERVLSSGVHAEGGLLLGRLQVQDSFDNPVTPAMPSVIRSTVFALSRDGGRSWKFNVLDCVGEEQMRRLFPHHQPGQAD